jgi:DNA-binding NarL/FixJ family response regulator
VALRLRCDAVDVGALSEEQRLAVLRWLLEHGRRDEGWPRPDAPTLREVEVLRLVDEGHRNRYIAARLRIRETTVQFHLRNLFRKLGAASRGEMIHLARQRGWIK